DTGVTSPESVATKACVLEISTEATTADLEKSPIPVRQRQSQQEADIGPHVPAHFAVIPFSLACDDHSVGDRSQRIGNGRKITVAQIGAPGVRLTGLSTSGTDGQDAEGQNAEQRNDQPAR